MVRFYASKFPEVDQLVMVQVKQIQEMGAYVKLVRVVFRSSRRRGGRREEVPRRGWGGRGRTPWRMWMWACTSAHGTTGRNHADGLSSWIPFSSRSSSTTTLRA